MTYSTIKEIGSMEAGDPVLRMKATVESSFAPYNGTNQYGDYTVQAVILKDDTEKIRASFWNPVQDRKSTRLNSSHSQISYAVFCLKKKTDTTRLEPPHRIARRLVEQLNGPRTLTQAANHLAREGFRNIVAIGPAQLLSDLRSLIGT